MENVRVLQVLRAFAACAVVYVHACVRAGLSWPDATTHSLANTYPDLVFAGHMGVDVFFALSGFLMAHLHAGDFGKSGAPTRFFMRRLTRIVPIYWLLNTVALVLLLLAPRLFNSHSGVEWPWLLGCYLFVPLSLHDGTAVPMLGPAWTLYFEMHFYVFFALALYFARGLAFLCLLLIGLVVAGFLIQPTHAWSAVVTDPLLLEFMAGIGVAVLTRRFKVGAAVAWSCLAVAAVWLSAAIWFAPPKADGHIRVLLWGVPSTLLLAGAVWLNPACKGRLGRMLVLVGDASYSIYLFQVFALPAIAVFLRTAHLDRFLGIETRTVLMWLLGCGAGVAFWAVVERPLTRRVKGWLTDSHARKVSPAPVPSRS